MLSTAGHWAQSSAALNLPCVAPDYGKLPPLAAVRFGLADGLAHVRRSAAAARMCRASREEHQFRPRRADHSGRQGRKGSLNDAAGGGEEATARSPGAREGAARIG